MLEGGRRVDVGIHPRLGLELLVGEAARDPGHLHHVLDPLRAERVGVNHLVGEDQLVLEAVEVPHRRVDVDGLHRIATREVDAVEVLGELEEVPVALAVADPSTAIEVRAVGRARHVAEDHVPPADGDPALGIPRGDGELRRREIHLLHHERAVHAHVGAVRARLAPRGGEDLTGLLVQELDADLLEDPHRAVVHGLNLLLGEGLGGSVPVEGDLPGKLADRRPGAAQVGAVSSRPPAPPARTTGRLFRRHRGRPPRIRRRAALSAPASNRPPEEERGTSPPGRDAPRRGTDPFDGHAGHRSTSQTVR